MAIPSVHFEPDTYPEADGWHDLEHLLEDHAATWMLWEGEPVAQTADKLREMGIESVVFDPRGNRPRVPQNGTSRGSILGHAVTV